MRDRKSLAARGCPFLVAVVWMTSLTAVSGADKPDRASRPTRPAGQVLVKVNGSPITSTDVDRLLKSRRVPPESVAEQRQAFLEQLIETHLIQQFLAERQVKADEGELKQQVELVRGHAQKSGGDPDAALAQMGYSAETLRDELAVPLAWKNYLTLAVTPDRLHKYFDSHREEFDGTKVRASHIVIKVPPTAGPEEVQKAEQQLARLRQQILERETTFEDAARQYSEGPSREQGGDLGFFTRKGRMPEALSAAAFALEPHEMSQPFRSTFGVHLCLVTERKSVAVHLEDVRDDVLGQLSKELWKQAAAQQRAKAKIEWNVKPVAAPGAAASR